MTEAGKILDIAEGDYHLVVVGTHWGLVRLSTKEVLAQDGADDHDSARSAGLMAARVYAPDFHMSECYRRYREELLEATSQDEADFREWLRQHHQEVVNGFINSFDGNAGKFKLEDVIAHGRRQFARYLGKGV